MTRPALEQPYGTLLTRQYLGREKKGTKEEESDFLDETVNLKMEIVIQCTPAESQGMFFFKLFIHKASLKLNNKQLIITG